jgi:hypothetical protein
MGMKDSQRVVVTASDYKYHRKSSVKQQAHESIDH